MSVKLSDNSKAYLINIIILSTEFRKLVKNYKINFSNRNKDNNIRTMNIVCFAFKIK